MSPIKKRTALAAALAATIAVVAAGCSSSPSSPTTSSTSDGGSMAGAPASAWALTGGSEDMFRKAFDDWNAANPDSPVNAEWFANDAYKEKIRTAVGSGNAPTLIYSWAGGTLADYVKQGAVVELSGDVTKFLDRVIPSVAANGQIDGKTYAVPNTQSQPVVLYYNQDVLDAAGVTPPKTYSELLTAIDKLKAAGKIPIALAGQSVWPELMYIQYLTDRVGGPDVFQGVLDGKAGAWKDPAILEAATKIQELVDRGAFGDNFGSVVADNNADQALVETGKAGFILQGSWIYPNFLNDVPDLVASGKIGYMKFPAVDGGAGDPANIVGNPSNFWSVSAAATPAEQKTAEQFISQMVLSDSAVDSLLAIGTVPPIVGLEDRIAKADNSEYLAFVYGMVRDAPHFQLSWDQALPAVQAQALLNNLSQLFLGQITPQQFVDSMDAA